MRLNQVLLLVRTLDPHETINFEFELRVHFCSRHVVLREHTRESVSWRHSLAPPCVTTPYIGFPCPGEGAFGPV